MTEYIVSTAGRELYGFDVAGMFVKEELDRVDAQGWSLRLRPCSEDKAPLDRARRAFSLMTAIASIQFMAMRTYQDLSEALAESTLAVDFHENGLEATLRVGGHSVNIGVQLLDVTMPVARGHRIVDEAAQEVRLTVNGKPMRYVATLSDAAHRVACNLAGDITKAKRAREALAA